MPRSRRSILPSSEESSPIVATSSVSAWEWSRIASARAQHCSWRCSTLKWRPWLVWMAGSELLQAGRASRRCLPIGPSPHEPRLLLRGTGRLHGPGLWPLALTHRGGPVARFCSRDASPPLYQPWCREHRISVAPVQRLVQPRQRLRHTLQWQRRPVSFWTRSSRATRSARVTSDARQDGHIWGVWRR